jgi:sulfite reductase (ferredoxin)
LVNEVIMPEPSMTLVAGKVRYRIGVRDDLYNRVKAAAKQQGKSMTQLTADALEAYLQGNSKA